MASLTYMQLLRGNRPFRWLWSGQVVSELGNWFNFIAGLGLIRSVSGAAPEATAIMLVALLVPFAVFAPLAGALADRWSRRTVMLAADLARAVVALGYLLVRGPEDLWIAYTCAVTGSLLSSFFEAAKNAAMPNVASADGLLAGNALMFSSRFLLMSLGAALGGWASARFGYQTAFIINSASFLVSAYSVWKIPAEAMREERTGEAAKNRAAKRASYWADVSEGWKYIARYPLVLAIIGINVMWATGGGACNLVYDRLGGVVFAGQGGLEGDAAVAALYATVGAGAFCGMFMARRVGYHVELHGLTAGFIGWMLMAHGVVFAVAGLMPKLWMTGALLFLSRFIVGMEFAVQDTLLQRLVPDQLRGRVITTDRASEILVMSFSTVIAAWSLHAISPRTLAVISGLLSASPGLVWLMLFAAGKLRMPARAEAEQGPKEDESEALLVSAG